jgi:hypothetical protein
MAEVNVDSEVAEAIGIVQDATYDADWMIQKFNECLILVATGCRIPGLQVTAPVTALVNATSVAMPKSYLHDLFFVTSPTYPKGLLIAPDLPCLIQNTDTDAIGQPVMVTLIEKTLHMRPVPEVQEILTLYYYGTPGELAVGDVFPTYIPAAVQKELFANYALAKAYKQIEDGIDGATPNYNKYEGLASSAIGFLQKMYPNAAKARPTRPRHLEFF